VVVPLANHPEMPLVMPAAPAAATAYAQPRLAEPTGITRPTQPAARPEIEAPLEKPAASAPAQAAKTQTPLLAAVPRVPLARTLSVRFSTRRQISQPSRRTAQFKPRQARSQATPKADLLTLPARARFIDTPASRANAVPAVLTPATSAPAASHRVELPLRHAVAGFIPTLAEDSAASQPGSKRSNGKPATTRAAQAPRRAAALPMPVIQPARAGIIQREKDSSATPSPSSVSTPATKPPESTPQNNPAPAEQKTDQAQKPNLNQLAEQVYPIILRKLAIENERSRRWR
jgi:hypothetical protein